jgi:hypothetical protein
MSPASNSCNWTAVAANALHGRLTANNHSCCCYYAPGVEGTDTVTQSSKPTAAPCKQPCSNICTAALQLHHSCKSRHVHAMSTVTAQGHNTQYHTDRRMLFMVRGRAAERLQVGVERVAHHTCTAQHGASYPISHHGIPYSLSPSQQQQHGLPIGAHHHTQHIHMAL